MKSEERSKANGPYKAGHRPPLAAGLQPPASGLPSPATYYAAMVFALAFPTIWTWVYFVALAGHPSVKVAYVFGKGLQFAFPLIWVLAVCREPLEGLRPRARGLGAGLGFGIAIVAAMLGLYYGYFRGSPLLASLPAEIGAKLDSFGLNTPWRYFGMAAFYSLLHSFMEEYYWRWFTFGQLKRRLPQAWAIGLSALAFMGHHVVVLSVYFQGLSAATWLFSACVAVGGAVWAWLYDRTGSLAGPWIGHLLVDAGIMWIGYEMVF